jgi:hypothetical protein
MNLEVSQEWKFQLTNMIAMILMASRKSHDNETKSLNDNCNDYTITWHGLCKS